MNPRLEAFQRLGGAYEVRVLEPSPPADDTPPYFADDPVARGEVPDGRALVSPVGTGDIRWADLAVGDPALAEWAAARWLGPYRRLQPVPAGFAESRAALHELAEQVLSPARERANGKIGLRFTRGGFGTPFFGEDRQLRVEGAELVEVQGERETRTPIDHDATFLGDLYGFACTALEELRAEVAAGLEPSRVQLWPEHFDIAVEIGSEAAGARAYYGASPGDGHHPEPYLYVQPYVAPAAGELWNATGFAGAELPYATLLEAPDQRAAALEFFRMRLRALIAA